MAQHLAESSNFLLPGWTFVAEIICFLLILWFLSRFVVPFVQRAVGERQEMIRKQVEDADAARAKLAEAEEAFTKALTEARTEAAKIRENARAEAQRSVEELRAAAQEEYERIVARGGEQLTLQRSAVVRELREQIGTLAVELSEKIVDQRLSDDAQISATVDSFLADLRRQDEAGTNA